MTKPDDIPQDVWDKADGPVHTFCNNHHLWGDLGDERIFDLRSVIARAIMAATAEEREACALEMDRRATENANTLDTQAAYRNAAAAIRKRSSVLA